MISLVFTDIQIPGHTHMHKQGKQEMSMHERPARSYMHNIYRQTSVQRWATSELLGFVFTGANALIFTHSFVFFLCFSLSYTHTHTHTRIHYFMGRGSGNTRVFTMEQKNHLFQYPLLGYLQ